MKHYILMADIIESSQKASAALMNDFKEISNQINTDFKRAFHSPITITLGDEFQSIVKSLQDGIQVIIAFEESLIQSKKDFKLRYVLNYGDIDTPLNREKAYEMLGKGLTEARDMLEIQKNNGRRFLIRDKDPELSELLNQAFFIYQSFMDDWKIKDYDIVSAFLEHEDYKQVASALKKNTSLMWKRGKSLKINEYLAAKKLIYLLTR
jgi:hypothetical protein